MSANVFFAMDSEVEAAVAAGENKNTYLKRRFDEAVALYKIDIKTVTIEHDEREGYWRIVRDGGSGYSNRVYGATRDAILGPRQASASDIPPTDDAR